MMAARASKARHSFRMTWIDPLALLAVIVAALTIVALLVGGR